MRSRLGGFAAASCLLAACGCAVRPTPGGVPEFSVTLPMTAPAWAVKERELLALNSRAAELFGAAYLLPDGTVNVRYEPGGGVRAPDDLMECIHKLPLLYALGADEAAWRVWHKAWVGQVEQCTALGLFANEMIRYLDWHHNGEHYEGFWLAALCAPDDPEYRRQALKFASFFDGSDPRVPNYDPEHKVIRSMLTGGAGPVLQPTLDDWGGGEYWRGWLDCVHDGPANLVTTCFGANAFMLTGDERYRRAALAYIDAWRDRARANGGIIPSIVLPDGTVPPQWWGGVMGWNFTTAAFGGVFQVSSGPRAAWGNALLLSGDSSYFDTMRTLADEIWEHRSADKDGKLDLPSERGPNGWYGSERQHSGGQRIGVYGSMLAGVYLATMKDADLQRIIERREAQGMPGHAAAFYENGHEPDWLLYTAGRNPGWPERALDQAAAQVRQQIARLEQEARRGPTVERDIAAAPWHTGQYGPLVNLMTGGAAPLWHGQLHLALFRYFDPERRRPGIPPDCAVLVERMSDGAATLVLVNLSATEARTVLVQSGAYAEHQCLSVRPEGGRAAQVGGTLFSVRLAPGAGQRFDVRMKRYANTPTLRLPWDRAAAAPRGAEARP